MRTAALIFGLLASVLGGAAIVFGNLGTGLTAAFGLGSASGLAAEGSLYFIALVGLLGACLVFPRPRLGGVLMLLAAAAWVAASLVAGHGAVLFAAVPFTFVGAGGLVALSARRETAAREESPAPRRLTRDVKSRWPEPQDGPEDAEDEDSGIVAPASEPSHQRPDTRSEPDFGVEPSGRKDLAPRAPVPRHRESPPDVEPEPVDYADDPPEQEDYPPEEEDYVDADTSSDEELAPPVEYEYPYEPEPPEDEPPPEPGEPEFDQPRQERPSQDRWSLPDPGSQPPRRQMPPRTRYIAEGQQPAPARREAPPSRDAPRPGRRIEYEDDRDLPDDDFVPVRRPSQSPRSRDSYRDVEPYYAGEQQREPSPLRGLLRILVLLLFIIVVVGIAVAVYLDYARGPESILFGNREQPTANVTSPRPAAEPAAPALDVSSGDSALTDQPDATDDAATTALPVLTLAAPSKSAGQADRSSTPAPVPLARPVATAPPVGIADPFAYCHAVDTVDAPDSRYAGPAVPPVIASALGMTQSGQPEQVHWRCAGQMVLACDAKHSAACDLTPTVDLMVGYCAQHPNTQDIPAPNGSWSCNGTRPVIPRDQKWPVDARGFYPDAWSRVAPPTG